MTIGRGGGGEGLGGGGTSWSAASSAHTYQAREAFARRCYLPRRAATELTVIATITVPKT